MYLFLVHHLDTNTLLDITRLIVPNDWSIIWNPRVPHVGFGSSAAALPNCHPCCPLCVYISHDFPLTHPRLFISLSSLTNWISGFN